jgi:hypothetical protein
MIFYLTNFEAFTLQPVFDCINCLAGVHKLLSKARPI